MDLTALKVPRVCAAMVEELVTQIENGSLPPDSLLPSTGALAKQYQVGYVSTARALEALADAGYIRRETGKGSFVNPTWQRQETLHVAMVTLMAGDEYSAVTDAFSHYLQHESVNVRLLHCRPSETPGAVIDRLREAPCDSVVLFGGYWRPLMTAVASAGYRMVRVGNEPFNFPESSRLTFQLEATGYNATRHLLNAGYQEVVMVENCNPGVEQVLQGHLDACGIPLAEHRKRYGPRPRNAPDYYQLADTVVDRLCGRERAAVITADAQVGFAVLEACRKRKIRIPDDLGIVNIGANPTNAAPLATWAPDCASCGREAAAMVVELMRGFPPRTLELANQYRSGFSVRESWD